MIVSGYQVPPLTVASLATTTHSRPAIFPTTVTKAHEIRLAEHAVQLRVLEVTVDDGRPATHGGQRHPEPDASARTASPRLRTGDDDALDPLPQREEVPRQVLEVPPQGRAGIQQLLCSGVLLCGSEVQLSPPPR